MRRKRNCISRRRRHGLVAEACRTEKRVCEHICRKCGKRSNSENTWNRYRDCLLEAANEVNGWMKGMCRHGETWWWIVSVKGAVDAKTRTYEEWIRNQIQRQSIMQRRNVNLCQIDTAILVGSSRLMQYGHAIRVETVGIRRELQVWRIGIAVM